ncbi:MAG TPA: DNA polymerase IV [Candidatus Eisenbacteria bacterium]|nr:DNA polymerase IV [Candidatus Eisenbacteria bacterium]
MRLVAHLDMDAFFASVEEKLNPHLAGKPLVVGGDRSRRGVVSAANYPAREFGIRAGMPIATAVRLCPDAVCVEGDPKKYVHVSLQVLDSLKEFTPIIEPFSIDEAFLDLTESPRLVDAIRAAGTDTRDFAAVLEAGTEVARAMQRAVQRRVGLSATIGLAPNKYIAKMGSGLQKPRGLTVLTQERYREVFWPRPVQELWGIGEKTAEALGKLGIRTVGQLAKFPREFLTYHFGLNGDRMRDAAWGEDDSPVIPFYEGVPVKSMGHEFTLEKDLSDRVRLGAHLLRLSDQVARRMRQDGYLGRIVSVKFRDASFKTTIRQRALPELTSDEAQIHKVASALFDENWDGRPLRLIGVSMSGLVAGAGKQSELFDADAHRKQMTDAVDSLRDKFGDAALVRAGALQWGRDE